MKATGSRGAATMILSLSLMAACATTDTGRRQLKLLPSSELQAMGNQAFAEMKTKQPIEEDPRTNAYVQCIATALARQVSRDPSAWQLAVFDEPSANAFALPGGNIGVHTGILDVARTPDQLAAVVGHEMAHVTQEHANERVSQAFLAQGGLAAASAAMGKGGRDREIVLAALGLGAQIGILMPFGRTQETEADVLGLEYMARAGFDPRQALDLWRNMEEMAEGGQVPEFLSTHPSHQRRIQTLEAHMDSALATYKKARAAGNIPNCERAPERIGARSQNAAPFSKHASERVGTR